MPLSEKDQLQNLFKAIATAPAHCDKESQRETAIWLKREKSIPGFQALFESCPDFIEESPVFHKRTYTNLSTSARIVYEFGCDGTISAAAVSLGYFASVYGQLHDLPFQEMGPIEAFREGRLKGEIQGLINRAASIGAGLFVIGSQELNLWPNESAIMRIEEDLASLFLHIKLTLSPFGSILIIPTGDMNWITKKVSLQRICREAGLDLISMGKHGRIRLQWNPPVPRVQSNALWKVPSESDLLRLEGHTSFSQLLKNTQDKYPRKIMLTSRRSELARVQNLPISKKDSRKKKSAQSQSTLGSSSNTSMDQMPVSGLVFYQEQAFADLDEE